MGFDILINLLLDHAVDKLSDAMTPAPSAVVETVSEIPTPEVTLAPAPKVE